MVGGDKRWAGTRGGRGQEVHVCKGEEARDMSVNPSGGMASAAAVSSLTILPVSAMAVVVVIATPPPAAAIAAAPAAFIHTPDVQCPALLKPPWLRLAAVAPVADRVRRVRRGRGPSALGADNPTYVLMMQDEVVAAAASDEAIGGSRCHLHVRPDLSRGRISLRADIARLLEAISLFSLSRL